MFGVTWHRQLEGAREACTTQGGLQTNADGGGHTVSVNYDISVRRQKARTPPKHLEMIESAFSNGGGDSHRQQEVQL